MLPHMIPKVFENIDPSESISDKFSVNVNDFVIFYVFTLRIGLN